MPLQGTSTGADAEYYKGAGTELTATHPKRNQKTGVASAECRALHIQLVQRRNFLRRELHGNGSGRRVKLFL